MESEGPDVHFEITGEAPRADTLLCGFSRYGLAGLTAADYLVDHLELEPVGHVTTAELPTITPFEDGVPRHHSRLFTRPGLEVVVLVNELFVREEHRGTGVADDLLARALDVASAQELPLDRVLLDVDADNERARAFYRRHGFEPWGELVAREL